MVCFAEKLSKRKVAKEINPVVVQQATTSRSGTNLIRIDRNVAQAESLLDQLNDESGKGNDSRLKIVRRDVGAEYHDNQTIDNPRWHSVDRIIPSHLRSVLVALSEVVTKALEEKLTTQQLTTETSSRQDSNQNSAELITAVLAKYQEQQHKSNRLSNKECDIVANELKKLMTTNGPLQALLDDRLVQEIYVEAHSNVRVLRRNRLSETPFSFRSASEYQLYLTALCFRENLSFSAAHPIAEFMINESGRISAQLLHQSILSTTEPRLTIKIPTPDRTTFYELLQAKALPASLAAWLAEVFAEGQTNLLITGDRFSGKTNITAALASEVNSDERVITCENSPEIYSSSAQLEKFLTRRYPKDGEEKITLPLLVRIAADRSPKRIILGEIVAEEGKEFLYVLERGISGSLANINARSAEEGLWKFFDVVSSFDRSPQLTLIRRISRAINLVIRMERVDDKPCLHEILEVVPTKGSEFQCLPLVRFSGTKDGKKVWELFAEDSPLLSGLEQRGIVLRPGPGLIAMKR
jgi:pilus assembly protein CpaF